MNTSTSSKLERAKALIEQAEKLIAQAHKENPSLAEEYNLDDTARDLRILASNSQGYANQLAALDEILGECGGLWEDGEGPDPEGLDA